MTESRENSSQGTENAEAAAAATNVDEAAVGAATADQAQAADPSGEWKDRVLYLTAELENLRKRFVKEKSEVVRYANEELLKALLPVFDNLDLAIKSAKGFEEKADNPFVKNLVMGVEMTLKHFEQTLDRLGVASMKAAGQPFDPSLHEAIGEDSKTDVKDNHVVSELQKGFTLHGRVLRAARVIVNKNKAADTTN